MGKTFSTGLLTNGIWQDASNNIGIGGSPSGSYKLEVTGTGTFTGVLRVSAATGFAVGSIAGYRRIEYTGTTFSLLTNADGYASLSAGASTFTAGGNTNVLISNDSVDTGYNIVSLNGTRTKGSYAGLAGGGTADNNLYLNSGVDIVFQTGASFTSRMRITSAGSVLIGTATAPSAIGVNDLLVLGKSGSASNAINFSNGSTTNWAYILAESAKMVLGSGSGSSIAFETNAGSERMRITSGGDVGIGNANSSAYRLLVAAKDNSSSNYALVVTNSSLSTLLYIRNDGYAWISQTAWAYGSDRRLKENINYIETGLEKILALKPAKFDYIDGSKDNIGWIAQDVQEIIPEAVLVNTNDERGYLSLKSDFIIPYLVKAIQELNQQNQDLKSRLDKAGL